MQAQASYWLLALKWTATGAELLVRWDEMWCDASGWVGDFRTRTWNHRYLSSCLWLCVMLLWAYDIAQTTIAEKKRRLGTTDWCLSPVLVYTPVEWAHNTSSLVLSLRAGCCDLFLRRNEQADRKFSVRHGVTTSRPDKLTLSQLHLPTLSTKHAHITLCHNGLNWFYSFFVIPARLVTTRVALSQNKSDYCAWNKNLRLRMSFLLSEQLEEMMKVTVVSQVFFWGGFWQRNGRAGLMHKLVMAAALGGPSARGPLIGQK